MASRSNAPAAARSEAWFLLASLGPVALGVLLAVGLLHCRLTSVPEPKGAIQGLIVGIYRGVGFVAAFYACLLIVLWGAVAFVSGSLRGPLRRVLATLVLALSLSLLTASLGGDGGRLGAGAAARLLGTIGQVPTVLLFGVMTLVALFLATDWLFFRSFVRMASPRPPALSMPDAGLAPAEEAVLAGEKASTEAARGERPEPPVAKPREPRRRRPPVATEPPADLRIREQDLVDRAVAEARQPRTQSPRGARDLAGDLIVEDRDLAEARPDPELDPFADLDDEDLLARAGAEMEKLWSSGEPGPSAIVPAGDPDLFAVARDLATGVPVAERPPAGAAAEPPADAALSPRAPAETAAEPPVAEPPVAEPDVVLEPVPPRRDPSALPIEAGADFEGGLVQEELFVDEPPDPALIDQAAQIILTARRPMPSLLQRQLKLSFAQARQTMAYLEKLGVVGAPDGAGPWLPLIDLDEWRRRRE